MTSQAKRVRAVVYSTLAILAMLLPMTGWYARGAASFVKEYTPANRMSPYPRSLRPYVTCHVFGDRHGDRLRENDCDVTAMRTTARTKG